MAKNVADEHPTSSNKLLMNHISHISIFFGVAKQHVQATRLRRNQEKRLLDLATFHRPWSVRQGLCAAAAIKLTIYKDGSGYGSREVGYQWT